MAKDHEIEDLFSDAFSDEPVDNGAQVPGDDLSAMADDLSAEVDEQAADIDAAMADSFDDEAFDDAPSADMFGSYDEGEVYLDDDYFDEATDDYGYGYEDEYSDDYADDYEDDYAAPTGRYSDDAIIGKMDGGKSGKGGKGGKPVKPASGKSGNKGGGAGKKIIVVVVIVVVLAIIALIAAKCAGGRGPAADETEDIPGNTGNMLEENAYADINELINTYLNARIANDMATLATVVDDASALPENDSTSAYFSGYSDITVYTVDGRNAGDKVAYVYSQVSLINQSETLPDLQFFYIRNTGDNGYRIASVHTAEETDFIEQVIQTPEVQNLINQVWETLDQVAANNADVAAIIRLLYGTDVVPEPEPDNGGETAAPDEGGEGQTPDPDTSNVPSDEEMVDMNDTVYASTNVRIRAEASTDSEALGNFVGGDSATRTRRGETWSYITYGEISGYVMNEFLRTTAE